MNELFLLGITEGFAICIGIVIGIVALLIALFLLPKIFWTIVSILLIAIGILMEVLNICFEPIFKKLHKEESGLKENEANVF